MFSYISAGMCLRRRSSGVSNHMDDLSGRDARILLVWYTPRYIGSVDGEQ
jgi:hypothetical protein